MKSLFLATAAATFVVAAAPAFASPSDDAMWDMIPYPHVEACHFVNEPVRLPDGRVVYRVVQVCSRDGTAK